MPVRERSKRSYAVTRLDDHTLESFKDGYNSYAQSQSQVKDTEVPRGQNTRADDNGAMSDRLGKVAASPLFPTGYPTATMGTLKKTGIDITLALHGDTLYKFISSTLTALTGATFTPASPENCCIVQAVGRAYVFNGIDQPYYTSDGATLTMQTNAFPLMYVVEYKQRLYGVRPQYPDRLYFSNPITDADMSSGSFSEPSTYSIGNFGTFDVNLSVTPPTPVKNAGFLQFDLDAGDVITSVKKGGSGLLVETLQSGKWQVVQTGISTTAKTVLHDFGRVVQGGGCPAPLSVFTSNDNQQRYFGGDNYYLYGEVKFYQTPQPVPKSGRVQSEMRAIPASAKRSVVGCYFNNAEYIFYTAGANYNDRTLVKDTVLQAFSTPYVGWNVSCVLIYKDATGKDHLLAGSSDPNDPRIYELEVGTDDAGTYIDAWFADKNTDCNLAGIPKSERAVQVHYSQVTGTLLCDVYLDGVFFKTHQFDAPGTSGGAVGVGTQVIGTELVGVEGDFASFGIPTVTDSYFTIPLGNRRAEKVQVIYRKGTATSHYRILKRKTFFKRKKPDLN